MKNKKNKQNLNHNKTKIEADLSTNNTPIEESIKKEITMPLNSPIDFEELEVYINPNIIDKPFIEFTRVNKKSVHFLNNESLGLHSKN